MIGRKESDRTRTDLNFRFDTNGFIERINIKQTVDGLRIGLLPHTPDNASRFAELLAAASAEENDLEFGDKIRLALEIARAATRNLPDFLSRAAEELETLPRSEKSQAWEIIPLEPTPGFGLSGDQKRIPLFNAELAGKTEYLSVGFFDEKRSLSVKTTDPGNAAVIAKVLIASDYLGTKQSLPVMNVLRSKSGGTASVDDVVNGLRDAAKNAGIKPHGTLFKSADDNETPTFESGIQRARRHAVKWSWNGKDQVITIIHQLSHTRAQAKTNIYWNEISGVEWIDMEKADDRDLNHLNLTVELYQSLTTNRHSAVIDRILPLLELIIRYPDPGTLIRKVQFLIMSEIGYPQTQFMGPRQTAVTDDEGSLRVVFKSGEILDIHAEDQVSVRSVPSYPGINIAVEALLKREADFDIDTDETTELLREAAEQSDTAFAFLDKAISFLDPDEEVFSDAGEEVPDGDQIEYSGWVSEYLDNFPGRTEILAKAGLHDEETYPETEHLLADDIRRDLAEFRMHQLLLNPSDPLEVAKCAPPWLRNMSVEIFEPDAALDQIFERFKVRRLRHLDKIAGEDLVDTDAQALSEFSDAILSSLHLSPAKAAELEVVTTNNRQLSAVNTIRTAPCWVRNLSINIFYPNLKLKTILNREQVRDVGDLSNRSAEYLMTLCEETWTGMAPFSKRIHTAIKRSEKHRSEERSGKGFWQELSETIQSLEQPERLILTARTGYSETACADRTAHGEIASELGIRKADVTYRHRLMMENLIRSSAWTSILQMKLAEAAYEAEAPVSLHDFISTDNWLRDIPEGQWHVVKNLAEPLTGGSVQVIEINGAHYISPMGQRYWENKVKSAKAYLKKTGTESGSIEKSRAFVHALLTEQQKVFRQRLWEEAVGEIIPVENDPLGRFVSRGRSLSGKIRATLHASEQPLSLEWIADQAGAKIEDKTAREKLTSKVLTIAQQLGEDSYGLRKHVPMNDREMENISNACADAIAENGADHRWKTTKLASFLKKRKHPGAEQLNKYVLRFVLLEVGYLVHKKPDGWELPAKDAVFALLHGNRPVKRETEEAANAETETWIDTFVNQNPKLGAELKERGIGDEKSYQSNEHLLSPETRRKIGAFGLTYFLSNPSSPTDLARCAPPWVGSIKIRQLKIPRWLEDLFEEMSIELISDLTPHTDNDFTKNKGIGEKALSNLAVEIINLVRDGPENAPLEPTEEEIEKIGLRTLLVETLASMDDRSRIILEEKLGVHGPAKKLQDIAGELGISKERVRQIQEKQIKRLRKTKRWAELLENKLRIARGTGKPLLTIPELIASDSWFSELSTPEGRELFVEIAKAFSSEGLNSVWIGHRNYLTLFTQGEWKKITAEAGKAFKRTATDEWTEEKRREKVVACLPDDEKRFSSILWEATSQKHRQKAGAAFKD